DIILHACPGVTLTFNMSAGNVTSPITLTTAELLVDKNLTIQGPGANQLTVMRSAAGGTPLFNIFRITSGTTANISGLTLSNADSSVNGGAIINSGTLSVDSVTLSGNHTSAGGSAIFNGNSGVLK